MSTCIQFVRVNSLQGLAQLSQHYLNITSNTSALPAMHYQQCLLGGYAVADGHLLIAHFLFVIVDHLHCRVGHWPEDTKLLLVLEVMQPGLVLSSNTASGTFGISPT